MIVEHLFDHSTKMIATINLPDGFKNNPFVSKINGY